WTSTPTPKLLLEAGFSLNRIDYNVQYQNGQTQTPFSPTWYSDVMLQDTVLNLRYNTSTIQNFNNFDRYFVQAAGVYVTGAHQIRFGIQDSRGPAYQKTIMNGDLYAVEANGVPTSVTVFNTPVSNKSYLNADLGLYLQDTWTSKRLTITSGIRWEYLSNQIEAESADAGRFVPARSFVAVGCDTYPGISCFKNWAPRLSLVYDLFGSHTTALKGSVGKYDTPLVQGNLNPFNPMLVTSQSRAWINSGGCIGPTCFPTDDQIGPAPSGGFGTLTPRSVDPNYQREYNLQYTASIQHQLWKGSAVNFAWFRRDDYQQTTINQAVPSSAWTPVTITNPLDGTPITLYNLNPSYVGVTPKLYQTNAPRSLRATSYNAFETSVQARLPRGGFIFAGWTTEREHSRQCDQSIGANSLNDPNSLRYCDWYGNLYQNIGAVGSIPSRNDFKLQGSVPLWYKFDFSFSLYSDPVYNTNFALNNQASVFPTQVNPEAIFAGAQQGFKEVYWTLTSGTKYPADCKCPTPGAVVDRALAQGSETIMLTAPGNRLTPQLTQLDIALRRSFAVQGRHVKIEAQVFNVLNSNAVTAEAQTLGSSVAPFVNGGIGGVPSAVLNPRMLRLAAHFAF
ncbi:MAG TPA: TonB-dependent receptor, partial [Vicinamibacterales bacterium]|nr:TonB-dependent receptor [Vicinamibacterales bacterium]